MTAVAEGVLWAGACLGVWLLTLSSVTLPDLVLASASAVACGAAAVGGRWATGTPGTLRTGTARWLPGLPGSLLADLIAVLAVPWRLLAGRGAAGSHPPGTVRRSTLPGGADCPAGPPERAFVRRALAGVLISITPGTIALDTDPDSGQLTVHSLTGSRSPVERRIAREGRR